MSCRIFSRTGPLSICLVAVFSAVAVSSARAQSPDHPKAERGGAPVAERTQVWEVDTAASSIGFSIRHLVSRVHGRFERWSGRFAVGSRDWRDATIEVVIQTASINTANRGRDRHLRNSDFFDVERFPTITFRSDSVRRRGDSVFVAGHLTMKGVTHSVVLSGEYLGMTPSTEPRMHFRAATTINRMDYGVSYNSFLEAGGATLGEEVTVEIELALVPSR